jgi:alkylation response protein AidB-like acyl-CoA dehydrogenase
MATLTAPTAQTRTPGGSFLITTPTPDACFFPEDFTEEHRQIAQTTNDFAAKEVLPRLPSIEAKDFVVIRDLFKKAAALGLSAVDIPEEYGGLGMDKITSAIVVENFGNNGSFGTSFSAHTGIGTLPLVWYGTPEQKAKYLPKLADGTFVGAYALSESSSGSDALSAKTRAVLSEDGQTYTLNGEKMWITNGGFADIYTVFAQCLVPAGKDAGKWRLTAFLIERGTSGFSNGHEEHKMGIRGSSTTPLILTDCKIPASNLLGEVGKGDKIAFNILNVGRYKLGNAVLGGAKNSFNNGLRYSKDRHAFGKAICEFGLIQQKLANMASAIFACDAICYRTVGMVAKSLEDVDKNDHVEIQKRIEDYAVECSIVKVAASEILDMVVDESLQIFGGYGYVEDFPAERAYRDARINRIFEGTNEINRLIITGMLIKSAMAGKLALMPAIKTIMDEVMEGAVEKDEREGPLAAEHDLLAAAKKLTLFTAGAAVQKFAMQLADQQEVMGALSDMIISVYTMESAILRADKIAASKPDAEVPVAMARIHAAAAFDTLERSARTVIATIAEGDMARTQFAILRRLAKHDPADVISLRKLVAQHVIQTGKYGF